MKAEIAVDKEITKETLKGANKVGFESAMQGIKIEQLSQLHKMQQH